jgi:hypothetical protein
VAYINRILSHIMTNPRTLATTVACHFHRCSLQLEPRRRPWTPLRSSLLSSWAGAPPDAVATTIEDRPNRLTIASDHHHLPSSLCKRERFTTSSWCRRWRSHQKLRPGASYTANSGELPQRACRATIRSTSPRPESPAAIHCKIDARDWEIRYPFTWSNLDRRS